MDIGHLERKHHILAGIIVPVIALTNMVVMVMVSNRFIQDLKVANVKHNPWMVALFFVLAFIFPSVLDRLTTRLKERRKAMVV